MPPRILVFFLYINYVTIFMIVFKSKLPSKTVRLSLPPQIKIAVLQFFARMHKLLILVIPGSNALHLYVIACYIHYVIIVCKKVSA